MNGANAEAAAEVARVRTASAAEPEPGSDSDSGNSIPPVHSIPDSMRSVDNRQSTVQGRDVRARPISVHLRHRAGGILVQGRHRLAAGIAIGRCSQVGTAAGVATETAAGGMRWSRHHSWHSLVRNPSPVRSRTVGALGTKQAYGTSSTGIHVN
jgi:hypothetical protein